MKRYFYCTLLLLLLNVSGLSQYQIDIVINTNPLKAGEQIFIAGNKSEFGNWNPAAIPLKKLDDSTYYISFDFNKSEALEYKFTKGSWNNEALNNDGKVPENHKLIVKCDTVINIKIYKWADEREIIFGQITGNVKYHRNFEGKDLLPRDIIVLLPSSYDSLKSKYYPVLYMHDGQNIIDPATSSFGIDWQIDETADSLIRLDEIKEIIVVGIYNTSNRSLEYSNGDTGKVYMDFIVNNLKPFIDKNYRTKQDKENTAVAGSSLGGLISFMLVWEYSNVFSKAACLSPAFKYKKYPDLDYVTPVEKYSGEKKQIKLYIDNGGLGVDSLLQPGVSNMIKALYNKGFVNGEDLIYKIYPEAEHNEKAWSERVAKFLRYFFSE